MNLYMYIYIYIIILKAIGFIRFFKLAMAAFTYDCFDFPVIFSLATHVVFIIINFILLFGVLDVSKKKWILKKNIYIYIFNLI